MNSDCFVFVEESDEFRMWQGLVGPHYTPAVDSLGNLSWTNNGNLVNPPTVNVSGRGLTITGIVDTSGDLPATAPQYTCYLVGTTSPYHAYIFDGTSWTDLGIVGKGDKGDKGDPGVGVPSGGTDGQMLVKDGSTDYATKWQNQPTIPTAYTSDPAMDGTASPGGTGQWADGGHVHPTDTSRASASALATYVRPNLMDNWDFANPVNQRGQASYSNSGYTIDRWWCIFNTVTVLSDGLQLFTDSGAAYPGAFRNAVTSPKSLAGKTVTVSILVTSISTGGEVKVMAVRATGMNAGMVSEIGAISITSPGLYSKTATLSSNVGSAETPLFLVGISTTQGTTAKIQAIKLELGSGQTLAHYDSTAAKWVLNEIPDYGTELAKCQAYFARIPTNGTYTRPIAFGMTINTTSLRFAFNLPQVMANASPTVTASSGLTFRCYHEGTTTDYIGPSFSNPFMHGNVCTCFITGTNFTAYEIYVAAIIGEGQYIDFSCEP